ncbi:MAG: ATP-binding protein [Granulosicoccaceae bacterium]
MKSISARLLVSTAVVLTIFFVLIAISVSYSVHKRAEAALVDRLQGLIYGVLAATDVSANNQLLVSSDELPDPRLTQSTSGLFVEMVNQQGELLWQSQSSTSFIPTVANTPVGEWVFEQIENDSGKRVHRLQLATVWEYNQGQELPFTIQAVSPAESINVQLRQFDRSLWISLLISGIGLLLMQLWILSKSLQPLNSIGDELQQIEQGERDQLSNTVPTELAPLASSINTLLTSERNRHKQYRHLLDDLAHSLKTPLSVLKNLGKPSGSADNSVITTVNEQTTQIQSTLQRYLQRATHSTPQKLAAAISPLPVIERLASSLQKIYSNNVSIAISIETANEASEKDKNKHPLKVRIADADLYEIFGNILDNACKYGATAVSVQLQASNKAVVIDDNGPGFPQQLISQLTERGVRADTQLEGMGLGLAASAELMQSYGGSLKLGAPDDSSGARVILKFA